MHVCMCVFCRSVVINTPTSELLQYQVTYSNGMGPSTFTGALPPVAAQVQYLMCLPASQWGA